MSSRLDPSVKRLTRQPEVGRASLRRPNNRGSVGQRVRRHMPDFKIVAYVSLLVVIGLVIIFAIGPQHANMKNILAGDGSINTMYFVTRQFLNVIIATFVFMLTATLFNFEFFKKHAFKFLGVAIGLCALLFITGNVLGIEAVAQCALGACRWFIIPGFGNFQPAEALKLSLLVYTAAFLAVKMKTKEINDWNTTIFPLLIILGVSLFFVVVLQKDLGTGIAIVSIVAAMLVMSGVSWKNLGILGSGLLAMGVLMIISAPHRIERVATFLQGDEASLDDDGYHITHAKIAIGSGGFTGVGVGNSVQATGYVPEAINDSIIAILGETFGFIGLMAILVIFFLLLIRLLKIMDHVLDDSYKLLVVGVFGWIGSHVVINIAAMTGLMPLTGITLPFLSYGGSSMMFIAAALGMVFHVSRFTTHQVDTVKSGDKHEDSRSGRRVRGTRYTSSRSR